MFNGLRTFTCGDMGWVVTPEAMGFSTITASFAASVKHSPRWSTPIYIPVVKHEGGFPPLPGNSSSRTPSPIPFVFSRYLLKVRASDVGLAIVRRGRDFEQKHVNKGPFGLMRQIGFRFSNFLLEAAKHDGFLYASWCDLVLLWRVGVCRPRRPLEYC